MNYHDMALSMMIKVCETDEICEDLDMDLFEAGLIDSLSTISLILLIEEELNIRLQPTDIEREDIATVNNFKSFLERRNQ